MNNTSPFMRESEVAIFLGVSTKSLQKWRWQGRGPRFAKFGSNVRYALDDVKDYAEKSMVNTGH